jgi:hypothetical protein
VPADAGEKVAMVEETIKETLCVYQYSFMLVIYFYHNCAFPFRCWLLLCGS